MKTHYMKRKTQGTDSLILRRTAWLTSAGKWWDSRAYRASSIKTATYMIETCLISPMRSTRSSKETWSMPWSSTILEVSCFWLYKTQRYWAASSTPWTFGSTPGSRCTNRECSTSLESPL